MFGLGNWQAVSNHIGSKVPMACHSHYMRIWVESPNFPNPHVLPQMANVNPLQVGVPLAEGCHPPILVGNETAFAAFKGLTVVLQRHHKALGKTWNRREIGKAMVT